MKYITGTETEKEIISNNFEKIISVITCHYVCDLYSDRRGDLEQGRGHSNEVFAGADL